MLSAPRSMQAYRAIHYEVERVALASGQGAENILPHWNTVIHPLLRALNGGPVIEIGAAKGDATAELAEFASTHDVVLHSIDPEPKFDVAAYEARFGGHFHFHRARSHDVLEHIGPAVAVVIDGDHNWYTVHRELILLERIAASADQAFPVVILHDVEWPYARRDMYYDPEAIPGEWRNPWDRRGITWGDRLLDEGGGGVNCHLANAIEEGGAHNGVLTAVEDFIEETPLPVELRIVRGEAGIGVLATRNLLETDPSVRSQWDRLHSPEFLLQQAKALSEAAARATATGIEADREVRRLKRELAETRQGQGA
jgi:hypothetical protein